MRNTISLKSVIYEGWYDNGAEDGYDDETKARIAASKRKFIDTALDRCRKARNEQEWYRLGGGEGTDTDNRIYSSRHGGPVQFNSVAFGFEDEINDALQQQREKWADEKAQSEAATAQEKSARQEAAARAAGEQAAAAKAAEEVQKLSGEIKEYQGYLADKTQFGDPESQKTIADHIKSLQLQLPNISKISKELTALEQQLASATGPLKIRAVAQLNTKKAELDKAIAALDTEEQQTDAKLGVEAGGEKTSIQEGITSSLRFKRLAGIIKG